MAASRDGERDGATSGSEVRVGHASDVGAVRGNGRASRPSSLHGREAAAPQREEAWRPGPQDLEAGLQNRSAAPTTASRVDPKELGGTLGAEHSDARGTRDVPRNGRTSSNNHGLLGRVFEPEERAEARGDVVGSEGENAPNRGSPTMHNLKGEVVDIQSDLEVRPAVAEVEDNVEQKQTQLGSGRARAGGDAKHRDDGSRTDTIDRDGPGEPISRERQAEHDPIKPVSDSSADEKVVRDLLEGFDNVKVCLPVLRAPSGRSFSTKGDQPRGPLRAHASSPKHARQVVRSLPPPSRVGTGPHPNPNEGGEQPDGARAPIGLGEQDDDDKVNDKRPAAVGLNRLIEQAEVGKQRVREPEQRPGRDVVATKPRATREAANGGAERIDEHPGGEARAQQPGVGAVVPVLLPKSGPGGSLTIDLGLLTERANESKRQGDGPTRPTPVSRTSGSAAASTRHNRVEAGVTNRTLNPPSGAADKAERPLGERRGGASATGGAAAEPGGPLGEALAAPRPVGAAGVSKSNAKEPSDGGAITAEKLAADSVEPKPGSAASGEKRSPSKRTNKRLAAGEVPPNEVAVARRGNGGNARALRNARRELPPEGTDGRGVGDGGGARPSRRGPAEAGSGKGAKRTSERPPLGARSIVPAPGGSVETGSANRDAVGKNGGGAREGTDGQPSRHELRLDEPAHELAASATT